MANFPALGMRPHPLHPHAVRLWLYVHHIVGFSGPTCLSSLVVSL